MFSHDAKDVTYCDEDPGAAEKADREIEQILPSPLAAELIDNPSAALPRIGITEMRGRQVVWALHAHLVFVTKFRRDVLSAPAIRDLSIIFAKACRDFEAELVECSGGDDHVHPLVTYPPKVSLIKLVNSLKGVSSRKLRDLRPEITGRYRQGVLWSLSYLAASCGEAPTSVVGEFLRSQRADARSPRLEGRGFEDHR
jgi:putative transposase